MISLRLRMAIERWLVGGLVGHAAALVVSQPGQDVLAAALSGDRPAPTARSADPSRRAGSPDSSPTGRSAAPASPAAVWGSAERLLAGGQIGVGETRSTGNAEHLGQLARGDDEVEALLDVRRCQDDLRRITRLAVDRGQQIALLDFGSADRWTDCRAAPRR